MGDLTFLGPAEAERAGLPWPDVYFTPAYGRALEHSDDAPWEVAVWEPGPILYPYLKRSVAASLIPGATGDLFDLVSPYGYSGTWSPDEVPDAAWREFRRELKAALRERGAVAEFQRLSSLVPGRERLRAADPDLTVQEAGSTFAIDLSGGEEECWAAFEGRARTKTRKAKKLGYTWTSRVARWQDLEPGSGFRALYDQRMREVGASSYYLFPDGYYRALVENLGDAVRILEVTDGSGRLGAVGLFFVWGSLVHAHLVVAEPWAARDGAGNLVYAGLIRWACGEPGRFRLLHIGGGLAPGDSLHRFKRSFGGAETPFSTTRLVLAPDTYQELVERRAGATDRSAAALERSGYFPAYRA